MPPIVHPSPKSVSRIAPFPGKPAPRPYRRKSGPSLSAPVPEIAPRREPPPLWAAVHFPDLAAEIFGKNEEPLAVYRERGQKRHIEVVNEAARALGIYPGLTPAAACALEPQLRLQSREEKREHQQLQSLARRLGRFSSKAAISPRGTVLLEVGGSLRLFGGAERLFARMRGLLESTAYRFFLAGAPTPPAAALLARCGRETLLSDPSQLVSAVGGLEVAALEIDNRELEILHRMGVTRVTELLRLPRDGLARRTSPDLLGLLDQLLGKTPAPMPFHTPAFRFRIARDLEFGSGNMELLIPVLCQMLQKMDAALRRRCAAIQKFRVELFHQGGGHTPLQIFLSRPGRDLERWERLLRLRMERLQLPAPVCRVILRAGTVTTWEGASRSLLPDDPATGSAQREKLLEQLQNRLGNETVTGLELAARHLPEKTWRSVPPGKPASNHCTAPQSRPLWLLPEPRLLPKIGGSLCANKTELRLDSERERIRCDWWDGALQSRDYRTALNGRGELLWIFRDNRSRQWYLHGYY